MRTAKAVHAAMLSCGATIAAASFMLIADSAPASAACKNRNALGISRVLVVDPSQHGRLGAMQYQETLPLRPREVVLTFDDGPLPPYSTHILDVLAAECVKATYFLVGSMARAYPQVVARIAANGHTIGTHSQNHPLSFHTMGLARAKSEIQGGIASVTAALGGRRPAPFFRIPGLLRATPVERYLASNNMMTWSADIPSDDWRRINDREIVRRTLARLEARGRGMILLHDIKPATALALPRLLRELKARGYRIVHVVPATRYRRQTATLPRQWLSYPGSRHAARAETSRAEASVTGSRGAWPRTLEQRRSELLRRRHAAQPRANVAVILEADDPGMVERFEQSRSLFSGLLDLPRQLLQ